MQISQHLFPRKVNPSSRRCLEGNTSGFKWSFLSHSVGKENIACAIIIISLGCIADRSFSWLCKIPSVEAASQGYIYILLFGCFSLKSWLISKHLTLACILSCILSFCSTLHLMLANDKPFSAKQFKFGSLSSSKLIWYVSEHQFLASCFAIYNPQKCCNQILQSGFAKAFFLTFKWGELWVHHPVKPRKQE